MTEKSPLPPKDAELFSTVCQFCIVGCGYKVYKWPEGQDGDATPEGNAFGLDFTKQQPAFGTWVPSLAHSIITQSDGRYNIAIIPDDDALVNSGMASVRGAGLAASLYRPDGPTKSRLSTPMVRTSAGAKAANWDEATELGGRVIKAVMDHWGADAVGMKFFDHGGGGGGFENNWAVGRFFFEGIQTQSVSIHNRPAYNSEIHAASDAGIAPLTNAYLDAQLADTIVIVGANPYETQTNYFLNHMIKNLSGESISSKENFLSNEEFDSGRMIIIDPRRTMTVATAEAAAGYENILHLQLEPGSDLWLLNAIARVIYDRNWHDIGFIQNRTEVQTWEAYQRSTLMSGQSSEEFLNEASIKSGIEIPDIIKAAEWIAKPKASRIARRTLFHYEKGLIWGYKNYENIASIVDLALMTGNLGKPGTGCSRLGGHQEAYVRPKSNTGRPARNIDEALRRGDIKVFWVAGCNPVQTTLHANAISETLRERGRIVSEALKNSLHMPVSEQVAAIIEALKQGGIFLIGQDIYPTATTDLAHIVLPAATWGEINMTSINGERRLRLYQKFMEPPGNAISDWKIMARFARALHKLYSADENPEMANRFLDFDWTDDQAVFIDARHSFSGNYDDPMEGFAGVDYKILHGLGINGIQTPTRLINGALTGTERLFEDRPFSTPSGKARFIPAPPPWKGYAAKVEKQRNNHRFWINNGRSNHIWQTAYHHKHLTYYNERAPIPYLEIHARDAEELGIFSGDLVEVYNQVGSVQAMAYLAGSVKQGHCFMLFGQPRGAIGKLILDHVDPDTTIPWYKGVWADVRRIGQSPDLSKNISFKPTNFAG
ncbi:MAG: arsenate reductase (azurin) large subunit [Paracoccaceae bacterium]|nr:arsenate reductase (azurin) large subunit [Paracoccaceae bacterium]